MFLKSDELVELFPRIKTGEIQLYRTLVETSPMMNNDERAWYSLAEITFKEFYEFFGEEYQRSNYNRFRLCRPVKAKEIEMGLDVFYSGVLFDEPHGELTPILDDFHKFKTSTIDRATTFWNNDYYNREVVASFEDAVKKEIIDAVAYSFYDCMSAGAGKYFLSAARYFIEKLNIDLDADVYPGRRETWEKVRDFLKEIEDIPRLEDLVAKFGSTNIPLLMG